MLTARRFVRVVAVVWLAALASAVLTWPPAATAALFGGGAAIAFLAERVVIRAGWLTHHIDPAIRGVPLYALAGWTAVVYAAARVALLVTAGWTAVATTAVLAAAFDAVTDPIGVASDYWTYRTALGGPQYCGVPWWNTAGWLAVAAATAAPAVMLQ
ncbi:carotenoid biosynthesis protein [Halobacterium salinarum]|uniref:carotenoid biosynthesis protein n=1 Tax=Halobacterium TaxID=2239 RepID=UPI0025553AEF|nr:carotenoid biosynthesis protein [Halobacterium salinarum]MDL0140429.1 carotenoid biosynthesis protein [Halobacterium salinarum]